MPLVAGIVSIVPKFKDDSNEYQASQLAHAVKVKKLCVAENSYLYCGQ